MSDMLINTDYNLPEGFYQEIKPYLQTELTPDYSAAALIRLWQSAINYRKQYPELQESIAEWTKSAASGSSLLNDNNLYEAIHNTFGSLEVPNDDQNKAKWQQLEMLITEAAQKL